MKRHAESDTCRNVTWSMRQKNNKMGDHKDGQPMRRGSIRREIDEMGDQSDGRSIRWDIIT